MKTKDYLYNKKRIFKVKEIYVWKYVKGYCDKIKEMNGKEVYSRAISSRLSKIIHLNVDTTTAVHTFEDFPGLALMSKLKDTSGYVILGENRRYSDDVNYPTLFSVSIANVKEIKPTILERIKVRFQKNPQRKTLEDKIKEVLKR